MWRALSPSPCHTRLFAGKGMVGRWKEESSQPPEVLAGKLLIDWGEEVVGRPPKVLAGKGGDRPA